VAKTSWTKLGASGKAMEQLELPPKQCQEKDARKYDERQCF